MRTNRSVLVVAAAAVAWSLSALAAERLDYRWFLRQVADLDRLPYLEDGVVSRQFSSYNRASHYDRVKDQCVGMDANGDAGHRLSVHSGPTVGKESQEFGLSAALPRIPFGDLEWVLDPVERNHVFFFPRPGVSQPATVPPENLVAAIAGPGCIVRIWSADPMGSIRLYLDGGTTPVEFDFKSLFLQGAAGPDEAALARRAAWPFVRPMTFRRPGDSDQRASDCYLPIPFARSCLVTLSQPSFYHFGYKTYPATTEVETFHLPLSPEEDQVLAEVCARLLACGVDPKTTRPGTETLAQTVELAPGGDLVLADLAGPRVVQALHAKLAGGERYAQSQVLVTAFFDEEPGPSVWCPLANLFGSGFVPRDYRSLPLGYVDGEGYCYYPMPFRSRGRFAVRNEGSKPVTLSYRLVHAPAPDLPASFLHFKAKYRREETCRTFDYPFLVCEGRGRFLGASLCIDDAWRSWWGEGDEKIWVDDDKFPSFFGTGSEDFFGDAWGIGSPLITEPFFAASLLDHNRRHARTCCYRWLVPDDVPFRARLTATIENYPETQWGATPVAWDEDYVSVAYWYQAPGGTDFFSPVAASHRRPWGKVPTPPVIEAEDAFVELIGKEAVAVSDEGLDHEFSRGMAVDLGPKQPGDTVEFSGPELTVEGPYALTVHTPPQVEAPAAFTVVYDGQEIGQTPASYGKSDMAPLGAAVFPVGRPKLTLRFTAPGRAVVDCFQFGAARQLQHVREAETAKVLACEGPEPARDMGVLWSGGRHLRFPAAKPGDAIELEVTIPPGRWSLCVGLTRGPEYGNWEATLDAGAGVVLRAFAPRLEVRDWQKIGRLQGKNGPTRVRFVCVGKDPQATGSALGLDYLGWQPVVVADAIEGETAEIVDVKDGHITDQLLGPRFSGGNHLWFHPRKAGASFTWLVHVATAGPHVLSVYFTKSWDYAVVRVSLDGRALGEFDTYDPVVTWGGETKLGSVDLERGQHRLTFEVVGRNDKSKGILVGVDCITLVPTRN